MILGMDHDDESVFERTLEFLEKNRIEYATFHILTPVPGTILYKRMEQEGRILIAIGQNITAYTVFKPRLMSPEARKKAITVPTSNFIPCAQSGSELRSRGWEMFYKLALNLAYKRMIFTAFPKENCRK